jgi:citrate lyase subunit beta/citryl-CoA lyase
MPQPNFSPRRSVLYVPASNARAVAKIPSLACDAVILDLEDSVAPADKVPARESLAAIFANRPAGPREIIIRVNPLAGEWGSDDLLAAIACAPDGILLPKVDTPRDVLEAGDVLDDKDAAARLSCLVAGTNDLVKETGILPTADRRYLTPWLMQMVLAARAGGLDILDGVANDFRDAEAFSRECGDAAAMGFNGKTLIHPSQIEQANAVFSPSPEALAEAAEIVAAFELPENAGKNVLALDGRMVERLHLIQAEKLLAKAAAIKGANQ